MTEIRESKMFAPTYPYYRMKRELWHRVNPLYLVHPICNSKAVLVCNRVCDEPPEGAEVCELCLYWETRNLHFRS